MKYFKQLRYELDRDKLEAALHEVLQICPWQDKRTVSVNKFGKNDIYSPQICLTEKQTEEHSFRGGIGGHYDTMEKTGHEVSRLQDINEADYTKFIPEFAHTYFKEVYDTISADWKIGRVRLVLSSPRRALSWHRDPEPRIHVPIRTLIGSKMIIEDEVQIGSHCSIYTESTIDDTKGSIKIGKNARIGTHSTIMPGVEIGENAIIGAHSFVKNNVPANTTVFGIPAK